MKADLAELEARVLDVIKDTALGKRVKKVLLEADSDTEGADFLRVILETEPIDDLSDTDLLDVTEIIEDALSALDDRFASIRFADAA